MTTSDEALKTWLDAFIAEHGGAAGSIHVRSAEELLLRASANIPPPVVEVTRRIPKGKGMAGLAWERNESVSVCNLQTDRSGDVRPGAKAVGAQAAVAIPVRDAHGKVLAVVGIAFMGEREFDAATLATFESRASSVPL